MPRSSGRSGRQRKRLTPGHEVQGAYSVEDPNNRAAPSPGGGNPPEEVRGNLPLFPSLADLKDRHFGLPSPICETYALSASVCFSRFQLPPATIFVSADTAEGRHYRLEWIVPTPRERNALANVDDATRDGAYGVVIAAAEAHLGLVATGRTQGKTGADYYVKRSEAVSFISDDFVNFEDTIRLEVSGISSDPQSKEWPRRLAEKVNQARRGASSLPALAGVVVFDLRRVYFRMA